MSAINTFKTAYQTKTASLTVNISAKQKRVNCLRQHSRNLRLKVNAKLNFYSTQHMVEELINFENGL